MQEHLYKLLLMDDKKSKHFINLFYVFRHCAGFPGPEWSLSHSQYHQPGRGRDTEVLFAAQFQNLVTQGKWMHNLL